MVEERERSLSREKRTMSDNDAEAVMNSTPYTGGNIGSFDPMVPFLMMIALQQQAMMAANSLFFSCFKMTNGSE